MPDDRPVSPEEREWMEAPRSPLTNEQVDALATLCIEDDAFDPNEIYMTDRDSATLWGEIARRLQDERAALSTPAGPGTCPDCAGRGWTTTAYDVLPGDRDKCSRCDGSGLAPAPSSREEAVEAAPIHECVSWTYMPPERHQEALLRIRKLLKQHAGWWTEADEAALSAARPPSPEECPECNAPAARAVEWITAGGDDLSPAVFPYCTRCGWDARSAPSGDEPEA